MAFFSGSSFAAAFLPAAAVAGAFFAGDALTLAAGLAFLVAAFGFSSTSLSGLVTSGVYNEKCIITINLSLAINNFDRLNRRA